MALLIEASLGTAVGAAFAVVHDQADLAGNAVPSNVSFERLRARNGPVEAREGPGIGAQLYPAGRRYLPLGEEQTPATTPACGKKADSAPGQEPLAETRV